jgi:hypothetical protein
MPLSRRYGRQVGRIFQWPAHLSCFSRGATADQSCQIFQWPAAAVRLRVSRFGGQPSLACQPKPAQAGEGWSGRRGSNPRPTAWKAVTLPLSYSRFPVSQPNGGEGRTRTFEAARATDLQSAAFDRFATSPAVCVCFKTDVFLSASSSMELAKGFEPPTC